VRAAAWKLIRIFTRISAGSRSFDGVAFAWSTLVLHSLEALWFRLSPANVLNVCVWCYGAVSTKATWYWHYTFIHTKTPDGCLVALSVAVLCMRQHAHTHECTSAHTHTHTQHAHQRRFAHGQSSGANGSAKKWGQRKRKIVKIACATAYCDGLKHLLLVHACIGWWYTYMYIYMYVYIYIYICIYIYIYNIYIFI